jgi:hypothetical protein
MVAGKFLSAKPKFKSQVGWGNDHADIELADIERISLCETRSSFVFEYELMLLDSL